jgi:GNAT superfamily N-acetyltransferase
MSALLPIAAAGALAVAAAISARGSRSYTSKTGLRYDIFLLGDQIEQSDRDLMARRGQGWNEWSFEDDVFNLFEDVSVHVHPQEEPWLAAVDRRGNVLGAVVARRNDNQMGPVVRFSVAVDESARREGIAYELVQALIDHTEQLAKRQQTNIELQAWVVNPHMGTLLEQGHGFDVDGYDGWSPDDPFMRLMVP